MSNDVHPKQIDSLQKMTPAQRLNIALEFMGEMRQVKAAALRAQHPDWNEKQIAHALRKFVLHGAS